MAYTFPPFYSFPPYFTCVRIYFIHSLLQHTILNLLRTFRNNILFISFYRIYYPDAILPKYILFITCEMIALFWFESTQTFLCRLQPVDETRAKQLAMWNDFILSYCRHHRVRQTTLPFPLEMRNLHRASCPVRLPIMHTPTF